MFLDDKLNCLPEGDPQIEFYFSKRSRDQLKDHARMYHHLLPSPDPSLVSNAASTKSLAFWCIANGMVPVSPIGTIGSLPRIDSTGIT